MAEATSTTAPAGDDRQNALAQIQFSSIADPDLTPSEDETPDEKVLQLETVQSAIGVSIGQQQTRLTSPKTPAAEKAAALDDTDGGLLFEGWDQPPEQTVEQSVPPVSPRPGQTERAESQTQDEVRGAPLSRDGSPARLPTPWRASPKTFRKVDDHRNVLRDNLTTKSRRRTMSGGMAGDSLRKYIPFNLPSMPKTSGLLNFSLPSFSVSSFDNVRGRPSAAAADQRKQITSLRGPPGYSSVPRHDGTSETNRSQHPTPVPVSQHRTSLDLDADANQDAPPQELRRRPTPVLRRSNSEGSLLLYRRQSFASSLGDDSRFEHVQEQVNSRLKAIKDSWQDANFRISVPSLPNFSFGSKDDLSKLKTGASTPRATNSDSTSSLRVSFLANNLGPTSGRDPVRIRKGKTTSFDAAGMSSSNAATHPFFTRALQDLEGDLVVLGGYRGSILRSAEPPNRQLWVPIKVGLNLRKVDLEVGLDPEDEQTMEERIIPGGMLTHIGPVDIAKRLFKRLRASENARNGSLRVHNYGYDWRLSPHLLSRRLIEYLERLPCNQPNILPEKRGAIVIAHSLGGLITRHVINKRPDLVSGVVYAGVPQTCVNILGPLRNGDDVLLSSRVLTAQVNFTIRTSYALLPLDGKCFFNKHTKEEYPVDFFDIKTWEEYRLSPCIATPLPPPNPNTSNLSMSGFLNAMSQALPSLPSRKGSMSKGASNGQSNPAQQTSTSSSGPSTSPSPTGVLHDTARVAADKLAESGAQTTGVEPKMHTDAPPSSSTQPTPSTTVTIPHDRAVDYLTRTLAATKSFKQELAHLPAHTTANLYPPIALIYGKSTPTVYGARVESREAIKRSDAYDELAFASGDGVVLARAAMAPEGYSVVKGGVVPSERGHVTLLGDLEAVGRCLNAVIGARRRGVGLGLERKEGVVKGAVEK